MADITESRGLNISDNLRDRIAAVPALLLCCVLVIMLILDVTLPVMKDMQYLVFPLMLKIAGLIGIPCAALCFMSDLEKDRPHIDLTTVLFIIFGSLVLISTLANELSSDAVFGVRFRYIGVFDLLVYMAVYMYCSGRIRSPELRRLILTAYTAAADLIAAAFFYDEFIGRIEAFRWKREPAGMFFHGNHYGYFLAVIVIIAAGCVLLDKSRKRMLFGGLSLLINLLALAVNRTMGSVLAAGSVLILFSLWLLIKSRGRARRPLILLASLLVMTVAALLCFSWFRREFFEAIGAIAGIAAGSNDIHAGNNRWGVWLYTAQLIRGKPLLGYGCEGISEILYDLTLTSSPHNEPLTYALFFGIPAAVVYVLAVVSAIIRGLKNSDGDPACATAAFAAMSYFLSSLFGVAVFYTAPLLFVMTGMASAKKKEE